MLDDRCDRCGMPAFKTTLTPSSSRYMIITLTPSSYRYGTLLESVASVRAQTYDDLEIIVVNDASSDLRYYDLMEDVMMIHLPYNIGRPGEILFKLGCRVSISRVKQFLSIFGPSPCSVHSSCKRTWLSTLIFLVRNCNATRVLLVRNHDARFCLCKESLFGVGSPDKRT